MHTLPQTTDGAREQGQGAPPTSSCHMAPQPGKQGQASWILFRGQKTQCATEHHASGRAGAVEQCQTMLWAPHLPILPLTVRVGGICIGDAAARWTPNRSANQRMALFTHSDTQSQFGHQESLHRSWVSTFNLAFHWGNGHSESSTAPSLTPQAQPHKEDSPHWLAILSVWVRSGLSGHIANHSDAPVRSFGLCTPA